MNVLLNSYNLTNSKIEIIGPSGFCFYSIPPYVNNIDDIPKDSFAIVLEDQVEDIQNKRVDLNLIVYRGDQAFYMLPKIEKITINGIFVE